MPKKRHKPEEIVAKLRTGSTFWFARQSLAGRRSLDWRDRRSRTIAGDREYAG